MKTIKLALTGMNMQPDGGAVLLTKVASNNPSSNGVHKVNQAQLERLCMSTLGFYAPIALKQGIAISNGSAILTIDAEECKVGQAWENKKTGETGVYGQNADGTLKEGAKDWTKYSNHNIELGLAASMKMFEFSAQSGIQNAALFTPATRVQPVAANPALGIAADTQSTADTATV